MKKGFTLIEFLIILAIVGVLLSVIIPACDPDFAKRQDQSRIEHAIELIRQQEERNSQVDRAKKIYKMQQRDNLTVEQALRVLDHSIDEKDVKNGSESVLKVVK